MNSLSVVKEITVLCKLLLGYLLRSETKYSLSLLCHGKVCGKVLMHESAIASVAGCHRYMMSQLYAVIGSHVYTLNPFTLHSNSSIPNTQLSWTLHKPWPCWIRSCDLVQCQSTNLLLSWELNLSITVTSAWLGHLYEISSTQSWCIRFWCLHEALTSIDVGNIRTFGIL